MGMGEGEGAANSVVMKSKRKHAGTQIIWHGAKIKAKRSEQKDSDR